MEQVIRRRVVVQHGGCIELGSDDVREGTKAEVFVIVRTGEQSAHATYGSMFGNGRGGFATAEEADAFLRRERDSWDD